MSTWEDLRKDVLFALGENRSASASNEIRQQVDRKLQAKRDEIYGLCAPRSLLVYTGPISVTSSFQYAKIATSGSDPTPGFNATDYWRIYGLSVGLSTTTSVTDAQDWEYVTWDSWVRLNSAIEGNQRLPASFTVDASNNIYIVGLPSGTDTWNAWLHYYKTPAALGDFSGTPEIGVEYERVLTLGATIEFPDMFRGEERASIFAATVGMYNDVKKEYLRGNTPRRSGGRLRPFRKLTTQTPIFWPGLQTS